VILVTSFRLIPGRNVQEYEIDGDLRFRFENKDYVAADVYIESDFYQPQYAAVEIITTCNQQFVFDANTTGDWPLVAKRIYEQHTALVRGKQ